MKFIRNTGHMKDEWLGEWRVFYEEYFLTYLVLLSELQWAVHAAKMEKYEIYKEFLWVRPHGY